MPGFAKSVFAVIRGMANNLENSITGIGKTGYS
jgi:hypothetical protein